MPYNLSRRDTQDRYRQRKGKEEMAARRRDYYSRRKKIILATQSRLKKKRRMQWAEIQGKPHRSGWFGDPKRHRIVGKKGSDARWKKK
jgi:hypothetical protein